MARLNHNYAVIVAILVEKKNHNVRSNDSGSLVVQLKFARKAQNSREPSVPSGISLFLQQDPPIFVDALLEAGQRFP